MKKEQKDMISIAIGWAIGFFVTPVLIASIYYKISMWGQFVNPYYLFSIEGGLVFLLFSILAYCFMENIEETLKHPHHKWIGDAEKCWRCRL